MKKENHSLVREYFPNIAFINFVMELRRALKGCRSVLEIGCGSLSPLRFVEAERFGVDGYLPPILEARRRRTHHHYTHLDARKIKEAFPARSFDAVVAIDIIEHLPREEGYKLLLHMEEIARKKVVIFTPNGFLAQDAEGNDLQKHLYGWEAES